jgi:hypothetical protein
MIFSYAEVKLNFLEVQQDGEEGRIVFNIF